jgi:hypothetical protein
MRLLVPIALAATLSACASASSSRTGQCRVRSAPASTAGPPPPVVRAPAATVSGAPPTAPEQPAAAPREPAAQPSSVEVTGSSDASDELRDAPVDCDAPAPPDPVAAHEETIRRNQTALASAVAACEQVCAASGNICTAAAEICRLTGDGHTRCARARGACTDASRRRDGQCPACPAR